MVIGIIGIVMGAFLMMGGLGSIAMPAMGAALGEIAAEAGLSGELFEKHAGTLKLIGYVTLALGAALILFSILLLQRKKVAVPALMLLALVKIAFTFWEVPLSNKIGMEINNKQMEALKKQTAGPDMSGVMEVAQVAGIIFGVVVGCALPVFHIIWFSRRKIRQEVAGWGTKPPSQQTYQNI
jgi:hypothetical protein